MLKDIEQLFSHLAQVEPPHDLKDAIMARIHRERSLASVRRQTVLFAIAALCSIAALIPIVTILITEFSSSDFFSFFSLLFSDPDTIVQFANDFIFSLLESLPLVSLALFLTTLFLFLGSIKIVIHNIITYRYATIKNS